MEASRSTPSLLRDKYSDPRSPEVQLACVALLHSLDHASPEEVAKRASALRGRVEPDRFAAWCRYQNIVLLVYRGLEVDSALAETLRDRLREPVRALTGHSLYQTKRLRELLETFDTAGLPVMVLKGTGLDVWLYGGPGRRSAVDHDLMVPSDHVADTVRLLQEIGYACVDPDWSPASGTHDPDYHAPPFRKSGDGVPSFVELHWRLNAEDKTQLIDDAEAVTTAMWNRAEKTTLLGAPVRRLSPEDERLYLYAHAGKHMVQHDPRLGIRLSMLADLVRHADDGPTVDLDLLSRRAAALTENDLFAPLRVLWAKGVGGPSGVLVPDALVETGRWPRRSWERAVFSVSLLLGDRDALWDAGWQTQPYGHRLRRILIHATLLRRRADRWTLLRRAIFDRLLSVNEHDRRLVPGRWSEVALLPVRVARLLWNVIRH